MGRSKRWLNRTFSDTTAKDAKRTNRSKARRSQKKTAALESLEDRRLLATLFWDGDLSPNWNDDVLGDTNWGGDLLPANGDTLVFDALAVGNKTNNNNTTAGSEYQLRFDDGGFTLGGNAIELLGINDLAAGGSGVNVINFNQTLIGNTTVHVGNTFHTLRFNGVLGGPGGATLTKTGLGTLEYSSILANTFTGTTQVNEGVLLLDVFAGNGAIVGPLVVGDGAGAASSAEVGLSLGTQINSSMPVTVNSDGLFNLNFNPESIGSLTVNEGATFIGGVAELLVQGPVTMTGGTISDGTLHLGGNLTRNLSPNQSVISSDIDLNGARVFDIDTGTLDTDMLISGSIGDGSITKVGIGWLELTGNSTYGGPTQLDEGRLIVNGSIVSNVIISGGALRGNGTVGDVLSDNDGGNISAGESPGTLLTGNFAIDSSVTLIEEIDGPLPGFQYDTIVVTGLVGLGNPFLSMDLNPPYIPPAGTQFVIIDNDGFDPVLGQFDGLPEGTTFNVNGTTDFRITYQGGDGNDVVLEVNGPPVALPDAYVGVENQTLVIPPIFGPPPGGVLANDTDPNDDFLQSVLITGPSRLDGGPTGTLVLAADGSFTFQPAQDMVSNPADPNTWVRFTYAAWDGVDYLPIFGVPFPDQSIAEVVIIINAVNESPVGVDDTYTFDEDSINTGVTPSVLENDYSPEFPPPGNVPLTATLIAPPSKAVPGTFILNPDGTFDYQPLPDWFGTDSFIYYATDSTNLTSGATLVTITVDPVIDPPTANDDAFTVTEDLTLVVSAPGVLANDDNPEGPVSDMTAVLITGPQFGTLSLDGSGGFVYTPFANFNGTDSFTYEAFNGAVSGGTATVTITVAPAVDAPIGVDDTFILLENTTLIEVAPGVLANDQLPNAADAVLVAGPLHASAFTLNADGSFTYTPVADYVGTDEFLYYVSDTVTGLASNFTRVTLDVRNVNQIPVAVDDAYSTGIGLGLGVPAPGVMVNDTDGDLDALTAVLQDSTDFGTLFFNADGSFTYIPNANFVGADTFTYVVTDGLDVSLPAVVTITVNPNTPPAASDDGYVTDVKTPITVVGPGVLANDSDFDGHPLSAFLVSQPSLGTVSLNPDGSFTYTPNPNLSITLPAVDTFTYRAWDGHNDSNNALVSITLINDTAPIAVDDTFSVGEDLTLVSGPTGVLSNDSDADGDPLTAILRDGPTNGQLYLNSDGSFSYTPNPNFFGSDSFTYWAFDGILRSNLATVTIDVTGSPDAPTAVNHSYAVLEDNTLTVNAPGVLLGAINPDNVPLTVVVVNGPIHAAAFAIDTVTGAFSYTPNANFNGNDFFTYYLSSASGDSNIATVSITVVPVNDVPVVVDSFFSTNEDVPLIVAAPGVLYNAFDPDGGGLSAVLIDGPDFGTVLLAADGSFVYTPNVNFNGVDTFTYRAWDGESFSNLGTATITVNPVADVPIAVDDFYFTNEDTTLTVLPPGVLINDTDPDGGTLTASLYLQAHYGTVALAADGSFVYTPNANFTGEDFFQYRANNGTFFSNVATVTINVLPVKDTPVANPDVYTIGEDQTLFVAAAGVLTNDTDNDDGPLYASLLVGPLHGSMTLNADGSFTYIPDANWFGVENMTYRAWDGEFLTGSFADSTITINVTPIPDLPIANDDGYALNEDTVLTVATPGILLNDVNPDSLLPAAPYAGLTPTVVNGPLHGVVTVNADGSFSYTPVANYNGPDFFTYYVTSVVGTSLEARVDLTVAAVADTPSAADDTFQTMEDVALVVGAPGVLWNDNNPDSPTLSGFLGLSAMLVNNPQNGTVSLLPDGSFTYTPNANFNGVDTFTYTVLNEAGLPDPTPATVTINVLSVFDAPVAVDNFFLMDEDSTLTIPAPGVLGNDYDPDNAPNVLPYFGLSAFLVTPTQNGTLTLNADGSFTYVPFAGVSGVDLDYFTYFAVDPNGLYSNLAKVVIGVREIKETTVKLSASSDTGCSTTDRITKDNTPTFTGTTVPFLTVTLTAELEGSGVQDIVGSTVSDANGYYVVTSDPLADGQYNFFVEGFRPPPPGNPIQSTGIVNAGPLLIDTIAPVVTGAVLVPRSAQVYVGFQDEASGMCVPTMRNIGNYSFSRLHNASPRRLAISNAQVQPVAEPTDEQVVVLRVAKKHKIDQGRYLFAIVSGGVSDVAGNALDGEFNGTYPSGDGVPGGNFRGQFTIGHGLNPKSATPTSAFVPILTQPPSEPSLGKLHPGGPTSLLKKVKKGKK